MDKTMKNDLIWAMKKTLIEHVNENGMLLEDSADYKQWILEEATYEQLLNLCFNNKQDKYYDAALIESVILTEKGSMSAALRLKHAKLGVEQAKNANLWVRLDNMIQGTKDYFASEAGKKTLKYGGLALVGAVALGVAANYLYKRYFSASAKACKGKAGEDFKKCVAKFKKEAIKKTIQKLKADKSACAKAKNAQKCNARVTKEIQKWQAKLSKV